MFNLAINVLFMHSIINFHVSIPGLLKKNDVISSNGHRSFVRMTHVFDLEKCVISKTLLQVFKQENDLMQ